MSSAHGRLACPTKPKPKPCFTVPTQRLRQTETYSHSLCNPDQHKNHVKCSPRINPVCQIVLKDTPKVEFAF